MRCFLPAVPWLCCLAGTTLAWQARPENPVEEPAAQPAASAQDAEPQLTVEEAISAAIEAIDRLDAAEDLETRQEVVDEITRHIEQVLAQEPGNPWLHYLYGRVYAAVGRLADARDQLLKFAQTREGQNEWQTHGILGDLFVGAFPRLAKPHYERAAALKD